ncbi:ectonucleoside triphosphate diphosphohydrolase 8 isoform X1 [Scleropages formosus]|nr:ectonucleoside triphosphate diphosphohydrolase 8 isoform X1 [Scleropages formosus]
MQFGSREVMGKLAIKQTLVAALVAAVGCVSIIALILTLAQHHKADLPPGFQYGMVFDAGSTHTALFLYQWPGGKENNTGVVSQVLVCHVDGPGISSYGPDPPGAGRSLTPCLDVAGDAVPPGQRGATPVYLGATAGMRLLALQNATRSSQVLEEVAKTIQRYPFDFRGARILSGTEEGAYGWITINYLLEGFIKFSFQGKWLHPAGAEILGALDMGGASTQIAFRPREPAQEPESAVRFRLYGFDYDVYTHSYLCYGKEQAMKRLQAELRQANFSQRINHPCYHMGFELTVTLGDLYASPCIRKPAQFDPAANVTFFGSGDPQRCLALVRKIFNFTECRFPPNCAFNGVYQPAVNGYFFAFSAYFYTFNFLGLAPRAPLDRVNSTIDAFCRKSWKTVKAEHPKEKENYLQDYCASAVYMTTILLEGYRFNESWDNIYFQKKAADTDIGWTLGYMLNLTNLMSRETPPAVTGVLAEQWAAGIFFISFAVFLSFLILILLFSWNPDY